MTLVSRPSGRWLDSRRPSACWQPLIREGDKRREFLSKRVHFFRPKRAFPWLGCCLVLRTQDGSFRQDGSFQMKAIKKAIGASNSMRTVVDE